jgi:tetratricopeptide (TPR) repeat protein
MKTYFWLSFFLIVVIAGCATAPKPKINKEEALQIRKLGEAFLAEKKYVPAWRELTRALELDPTDAHIYYDLGIFYYEKKKYSAAIDSYQKALELEPDFATARNNLGVVYMELREWDKAIETLSAITEDYLYVTPHFPHFLMGQAYYYKRDFPQALEHFEECLELQPDFFFAAHWLGKTHLEMGNPGKAVNALENAVELTPAAVFLLDLGRAYAQSGNFKKADESFGKSASLATDAELRKEALEQQRLLRQKTGGR